MSNRIYVAIDLKSFYASVECMDRNLDPLTTNLVVADESRTDKTICLAVSPSLKAYGIPGRPRLFEVVQKVKEINAERARLVPGVELTGGKYHDPVIRSDASLALDYIVAPPRMARYKKISTDIYKIYLKYIAPEHMPVASETSETSDEPLTEFPGVPYSGSTPPEDTVTLNGGSVGTCDVPSSQARPTAQDQQPTVSGARTASGGQAASSIEGQSGSIPQAPPTFRNVEIGGGRITGYETPAGGGEERQFAMYNASQYMEPSGPHETVKTTDGESWYKQYAQPTVQKTPKEVSPGKIRYDEKIVQTMPQIPKRKDRV